LTQYKNNGVNKVKVTSNNVGTGTDGTFTDASPFCLSCHKAHDNMNAFGLIFLSGTAGQPYTEEGSTTDPQTGIRNLCRQCHTQGAP